MFKLCYKLEEKFILLMEWVFVIMFEKMKDIFIIVGSFIRLIKGI